MDIFSQPPTSFKLARDSPLAADLKSTISAQIPLLLGPLFDDNVLTEYITVLVCNGKTQYQARDDLDAFLGERSGIFVSWLWDMLLDNEQHCTVAPALKEKGDITACPEDSERKRNALGVKSEKAGDAATMIQMLGHQKTQKDVLPSSPKRDHFSKATSPAPDCSRNRQVSGSLYCDKGTVSVWDRLSRPSKAALVEPHVDNPRKYGEVQNDICSPFLSKSIRSRMRSGDVIHQYGDVIHQCSRYQGHPSKHYATSNFGNNSSGNRSMNDMQRKRNFVQVSQSDSRSGGRRFGDNSYSNQPRADKRSKFAAKTPRDLLSTVEDVKLRLRYMEREISLLRSRNLETWKNRKNKTPLNYGKQYRSAEKLTAEDHESRTVLVSNVHYAAKRDALFVYFARCGRVINVVLLSDLSSFAPDSFVRSAYVTFACLESVDKALRLSGTVFYSRALKVLKCNQKDALPVASTSPAVSYTGRSVQQSASCHGTRLLSSKRESSPCPVASEQSAPQVANEEVAELTTSGPEQPSLSLSPKKDSAGNSFMLNADSVMEKTDEGAQLSACGDELPSSVLPETELAGCTDIHIAEKVNMGVEVSASTDEKSSLISLQKDSVAEETNMEVQVQVSPSTDEQSSLFSLVKDPVAGETNMEVQAQVSASTEEQSSFFSLLKDPVAEETNMEVQAHVSASTVEHSSLFSLLKDPVAGETNMDVQAQVSASTEEHSSFLSLLKDPVAEETNMEVQAQVSASTEEHSSFFSLLKDPVAEETNMEVQPQVSACGDEQVSLIPTCTTPKMHNTEPAVEESNMEAEVAGSDNEERVLVSEVEDCSGDLNMHNIESIIMKTKMEAEVKACEDEKLAWVSVVEDGPGDSTMHNLECISEKTNMEEEFRACEGELPALVSVVEDGSGISNIQNPESSAVACLLEELHGSSSGGSMKDDNASSY